MSKFNVGDRVRFTDKCSKTWPFGPHSGYTEGIIREVGTRYKYFSYRVEYGNGEEGFVNEEHIELMDTLQVGKKYRVPGTSRYERTIIFKDERSVLFEEKNGIRNLCNLSSTKDWIEIIPEDWRVLYKNSSGDVLVSKLVYSNRSEALNHQDHYYQIIDVIRVDDKRPTIQPSA